MIDAEGRRNRGCRSEAWRDAVAKLAIDGRPYPLAYARWRLAEALLVEGDRGSATEAARSAHAATLELGAEPMRRAIEGLAARARSRWLRVRRCRRRPPRSSATSSGSRREREVLALVTTGRTNGRSPTSCSSEHGRRPRIEHPREARRRDADRGRRCGGAPEPGRDLSQAVCACPTGFAAPRPGRCARRPRPWWRCRPTAGGDADDLRRVAFRRPTAQESAIVVHGNPGDRAASDVACRRPTARALLGGRDSA